jgi:hypothetical protein
LKLDRFGRSGNRCGASFFPQQPFRDSRLDGQDAAPSNKTPQAIVLNAAPHPSVKAL